MQNTRSTSKAEPRPDLPPVDPEELENVARQIVGTKKPKGGWKKRKEREKPPKK